MIFSCARFVTRFERVHSPRPSVRALIPSIPSIPPLPLRFSTLVSLFSLRLVTPVVSYKILACFLFLALSVWAPTGDRLDDWNGLDRLPRDRHRKAERLGQAWGQGGVHPRHEGSHRRLHQLHAGYHRAISQRTRQKGIRGCEFEFLSRR